MDEMEAKTVHGRAGVIVILLVVVGIGVLGAGGYLAWSKRRGSSGPAMSDEVSRWCAIRQEWARQVDPLAGDIMLKSVKEEDRPTLEQLTSKRNKLSAENGRRIEELKIQDPAIMAVEAALIREGKVRANIAVEIHNLLVQLDSIEDMASITKARDQLKTGIAQRIKQSQQTADREIMPALAQLGGACAQIYRGPATDEGTSDSPYTTWDELEVRRTTALAKFEDKVQKLEPAEEFANRVYHDLVSSYRPVLTSC